MADHHVRPEDFEFISQFLRTRSGQVLEPGKEYLVRSRLAPLAERHHLADLHQLVQRLRTGVHARLEIEVVEAMAVTETSFFRDVHPFETLRLEVLPRLIANRRPERRLAIWCAASSSGQEPYSVAMLLKEYFPELEGWSVDLTATDMSQEMLERSRAGRYSQIEANRGLSVAMREKWFQRHGKEWQIDERIRRMVTFRQLNLAQPWPITSRWDLILMRNVMIYFDVELKKQILSRVSRSLQPDGYLLLGGAETTLNLDDSFQRVEGWTSSVYRRTGFQPVT
ncbi:MAG: protein-glutamate O-methyltransferase CheR [Pirellulales bacterium]